MILLKSVIHDTKTNSVEATWVDEISPAIEVTEHVAPDTKDADGNIIPGEVIPAYTIPAVQVPIKCHSYADVQMDMFRADVAQLGGNIADYETLIATVEAGIVPPAPPSVTEVIAEITSATQARLDTFAKTRNYDGILSACTYATSTNPTFAAEGQYCVTARDNTWAALYTIMAEVQAGTRAMPTGFADVEPLLPALAWPA